MLGKGKQANPEKEIQQSKTSWLLHHAVEKDHQSVCGQEKENDDQD
jgi:hypothetical protein